MSNTCIDPRRLQYFLWSKFTQQNVDSKELFLRLGALNNVPNFLDGEAIIAHRVGVLEENREDGTKPLGLARQKVEDGLVSCGETDS